MTKRIAIVALMALVAVQAAYSAAEEVPKLDVPVIFIGDSMMKLPGRTMEKAFNAKGIKPTTSYASIGSGLVRPSVFNWPAKADSLCEEYKPKTAFVALGANDRQNLELYGGGMAHVGTDEWRKEYARRVKELIERLFADGVTHTVWMLLPPMKGDADSKHAELVNTIVKELAASDQFKGKLLTYDMGVPLTRHPGVFNSTLISKEGAAIKIREQDGIHLTMDGSKLIAKDVLNKFWPEKK